ncbi:hypothetical protein BGZ51_006369 [Haplosporangium sp. Z 767]|nr:hypothetical protein BGZ50_001107 [Haplosporangium sp. Z 11]KAF9192011.1 hypothetical protein BGZ51_006369 [Haplosporangium sp. Z 767]
MATNPTSPKSTDASTTLPISVPRYDTNQTKIADRYQFINEKFTIEDEAHFEEFGVSYSSIHGDLQTHPESVKEKYDIEAQISVESEDNSPIEEVRATTPGCSTQDPTSINHYVLTIH